MKKLSLVVLPERLAICRLAGHEPVPPCPDPAQFWSVTRAGDELSVVLPEAAAPPGWQAERGWRCLKVLGPLDLGMTGVLASVAVPLAQAGVSIFAVSTYDTDYVLVKAGDVANARDALRAAGHVVS